MELAFFVPVRTFVHHAPHFPGKMTMSNQSQKKHDPLQKPVTEDAILRVTKEVVIKFIEVGRLSPGNFGETFDDIYTSVRSTVKKAQPE